MSAAHKSECPGGAGQYATNQNTNDLDFATSERHRKDEWTLLARLALAGHVVHRGNCNDYTVCKYGYAHYCQDLAELTAFAIRLGVRNV
jgi:hypothetical protein